MAPETVDLSTLPEGELMELAVPSGTMNRRVLVMWLYLRGNTNKSLVEFDLQISTLAEKELQRRATQTGT
ncbi:hypothetical protein A3K71_03120 [archaeon RBG_16_50_20]|nr:MAG: hypothetical protein A3K71_03120 [archaeon RBG_16_50_20]